MSAWHLKPPRCARCSRTVEHCDLTYAPSGLSLIVTARCHGSTETAEITLADVLAADAITVGDAFTTRQIAIEDP